MNPFPKRIVGLALAAASTLAGALAVVAPAFAQNEITIGAAAPLTGPRANLGRYFKQGADLAVSEINKNGGVLGKPLKMVYADDQAGQPERGHQRSQQAHQGGQSHRDTGAAFFRWPSSRRRRSTATRRCR